MCPIKCKNIFIPTGYVSHDKIGGELMRKIMGLCDDESVFTDDLFDLDYIIEKKSKNSFTTEFLTFINNKNKSTKKYNYNDITDYINLIESIILNKGLFKLIDNH